MQTLSPAFHASLQAARDDGIAPVWFFWVRARNRDTGADEDLGLWSGDEDISIAVRTPQGAQVTRTYIGGCNLVVEGIRYVVDLTDNPITVRMSQIADAAQQLVRGYDVRLAYCEVHATTWTGGQLTSVPDLQWIGIIDEGPIATPDVGGEGGISLSVRSELMTMLTATNPAKSSDAHQKRRAAGDDFCKYASTIGSRKVQWYKK